LTWKRRINLVLVINIQKYRILFKHLNVIAIHTYKCRISIWNLLYLDMKLFKIVANHFNKYISIPKAYRSVNMNTLVATSVSYICTFFFLRQKCKSQIATFISVLDYAYEHHWKASLYLFQWILPCSTGIACKGQIKNAKNI